MEIERERYKCPHCALVLESEDLIDGACPVCEDKFHLKKMCPKDHVECSHDVTEGLAYCDVCGEPCCPVCGSHDVTQISRVTGYLQDVDGWNAGKRQELKDRTRYTVNESL